MKQPANDNKRLGYLTRHEALDVSRMTGIPMASRGRMGRFIDEHDTYYGAVDQGVVPLDSVYINMDQLDYVDRMRVMVTLIAGYAHLERGYVYNGVVHLDPEYHQPHIEAHG